MRTLFFTGMMLLLVLISCSSGTETNKQTKPFGIYEVVKPSDLQLPIIDSLKLKNIVLENSEQESIVGLINASDSSINLPLVEQNAMVLKTAYIVDKDHKYCELVAVKLKPEIDNSDIKWVKANGKNVEIYFTYEGAKKWASFTEKSIGSSVALVIDKEVYAMPEVNSELKSGTAVIGNLESDEEAIKISEYISPK